MKNRKLIRVLWFVLGFWVIHIIVDGKNLITGPLREIAYVHTDRDLYVAGENIFFKVYLVDVWNQKISEKSRMANIILRNNTNDPIARIRLHIDNGITYGCIFLPDTLRSGSYQFVAFTNWMRNEGEEFYFSKEIFIANRFDKDLTAIKMFSGSAGIQVNGIRNDTPGLGAVSILPDKMAYDRREKINLTLSGPEFGKGRFANVSISVYEEVPGVDQPLSFRDYCSQIQSAMKSTLQPGPDQLNFLPEQKGEILQGKVIDQDTKEPVAKACVFLSVQDSVVNLQYDFCDSTGKFRFQLNDYYQGKEIYLSIKDPPAHKKPMIVLDDKFELKQSFTPALYTEKPTVKDYILKSQDMVTIQKTYQTTMQTEILKPYMIHSICPRIYDQPTVSRNAADFYTLKDFIEFTRELLPTFRLRKRDNGYVASMGDDAMHEFMEQQPAIFLDGVYIHDVNQISAYGSEKLKRIELINARYAYGDILFPGILAVFTKKGEINNIIPTPTTIRTRLVAFQPCEGLAVTHPLGGQDHQPDFRQILYWNPDIEISGKHTQVPGFYASDHTGYYIISVEGISSDGIPISALTKIKINQ